MRGEGVVVWLLYVFHLATLLSKVESKGWTGWDVLASVAPRHCAANGTLGEQESVAH